MNNILVTGAEGFIGSHLVEKLVSMNFKVRAFVLYNSFNSWGWLDHIPQQTLDKIEIFTGDIRDFKSVEDSMIGIEYVIHLAALIAIPYSYNSPKSYIDTNVTGTYNVLQAALNNNIKKVIHTSTSEVYGSAQYVPIDENHPIIGQSPYSASKISADQIAISFAKSFNLNVHIARPFNTYGPRQSARAIIPTIITQLLSGISEISLGSLHPTRDLSFIDDTVDGFISLLKANVPKGEVYNFGTNYEVSMQVLAESIAKILDLKIKINIDNNRIRPKESEVDRLLSNNAKAIKNLNYQPKYTGQKGLILGLSKTIEWFKNGNLKLYKSGIYNK